MILNAKKVIANPSAEPKKQQSEPQKRFVAMVLIVGFVLKMKDRVSAIVTDKTQPKAS